MKKMQKEEKGSHILQGLRAESVAKLRLAEAKLLTAVIVHMVQDMDTSKTPPEAGKGKDEPRSMRRRSEISEVSARNETQLLDNGNASVKRPAASTTISIETESTVPAQLARQKA